LVRLGALAFLLIDPHGERVGQMAASERFAMRPFFIR
jgi:hypothetical protein